MKNSPPTGEQGVRSWKELQSGRLPSELPTCLGKDVLTGIPALPARRSKHPRRSGRELAGRRAANASWNQPPLAGTTFYSRGPLEIPADTTRHRYFTSAPTISDLNGLSQFYPSTSGAKSLLSD